MPQIVKYPLAWRLLHWLMALMIFALFPIGIVMAGRAEAEIWGALTNTFYNWHKTIGFTVLLLMVVRTVIKVWLRGPAYPDTLPRMLQMAAHSLHFLLYVLLILTPLFGWAGVTAFPALVVVGGYQLPAMPFVPVNQALAERLFEIHGALAITLGVLILGHIGAATKHLIDKDGLFRRML